MNSKTIIKETPFTKTFFWKNLECELCKAPIPSHIHASNIIENNFRIPKEKRDCTYQIIKYEIPDYSTAHNAQYFILESISTNSSKVIHIVNMDYTDEIKIGRGHDADVRVTDISVSRLHAFIKRS